MRGVSAIAEAIEVETCELLSGRRGSEVRGCEKGGQAPETAGIAFEVSGAGVEASGCGAKVEGRMGRGEVGDERVQKRSACERDFGAGGQGVGNCVEVVGGHVDWGECVVGKR